MKNTLAGAALAALILPGCATSDGQKPEKGPGGTIAYFIEIESSESGARVEANNEYLGKTPMTLKIFGDKDGTFHNFGNYHYTVTAYPVRSGQQPQRIFARAAGLPLRTEFRRSFSLISALSLRHPRQRANDHAANKWMR